MSQFEYEQNLIDIYQIQLLEKIAKTSGFAAKIKNMYFRPASDIQTELMKYKDELDKLRARLKNE